MGKKIGLITFCDNTNYGSFLQTYGLYKYVDSLGYDIELIDYRKIVPDYERVSIYSIKRLIKESGIIDGSLLFYNIFMMQVSFDRIIKKLMKKSRKYTVENIYTIKDKYDVFLVGSDLVWDLRYADDYTYFLDFLGEEKCKIAYAASYGYEKIPSERKTEFIRLLSQFKTITVREKNVKDELNQLLDNRVRLVCDPTMLMGNSFWEKFIDKEEISNKYVLVYMPDVENQIIKYASIYARKIRAKLYIIDKRNKDMCPRDPRKFLNLIYNADKIFTGSYHGLLFSIYFNKNFSFIHRTPGNRMQTLVDVLDIGEYNILSPQYDIMKNVDLIKIKNKEEEYKKQSQEILRRMLQDVI